MIFALVLQANATEVEVRGAFSSLNNTDPAFQLFSSRRALQSFGLAVSARPHPHVAIEASWHRSHTGSRVQQTNLPAISTGFTSDQLGLGPKVDYEFLGFVAPYLTVQGLVVHGLARFDDDPNDKKSPGQTAFNGWSPGFAALAGVELSTPSRRKTPIELLWNIGAGYAYIAPLKFDGLGEMKPGGFLIRTALGARFGRTKDL